MAMPTYFKLCRRAGLPSRRLWFKICFLFREEYSKFFFEGFLNNDSYNKKESLEIMRIQFRTSASQPIKSVTIRPLTKKGLWEVAQIENDAMYNMSPEQLKLTIDNLWEHLTKIKKSFPQKGLIRLKLFQDESYILGQISPVDKGSILSPSEIVSSHIFTDGANFKKAVQEATTKFLKDVFEI